MICMKYELEFLHRISEDDFEVLAEIIRKKGGMNCSLKSREKYERKHKYIEKTIDELLDYGSNTFGLQVSYSNILNDVCERLGVKYKENNDMGRALLGKVFGIMYDNMSSKDKIEVVDKIFTNSEEKDKYYGDGSTFSFEYIFRTGELSLLCRVASLVSAGIATTILGGGVSFATNVLLTRVLSLISGPLAAIMAAWTIKEISGPAYRVTIPAVIYIESMRIIDEVKNNDMIKNNEEKMDDGVIYL